MSINGDGSYWHAPDAADGRIELIEATGTVVLCDALPGDAPHRPNDVSAAPGGGVVVTDSSNWEDMRNLLPGRIVHVARTGAATQLAELAAMPNGVAFTAEGALLVAQSLTRRIWSYPVVDGQPLALGEPVEVCRLPSGSSPDGLCLATDGRLFVCGSISDSVFVFDGSGELVDTIDTGAGSQPTNCCLDGGSLFITLAKLGQLVAIDIGAEPLANVRGGAT